MKDNINPAHYKDQCSIECIEAMEIILGAEGLLNYCLGNAIKYLWRCKYKGGYEDILKAEWYIKRADDMYEKVYDTTQLSHQLFALRELVDEYKRMYGGK
jgi:hypothetical protein